MVGLVVGIATMVLVWPVGPQTDQRSGDTRGDTELAEQARTLVGDSAAIGGMSVALVEPDSIRSAAFGARDAAGAAPLRPGDPMEIGSIAKALTGMLLADLVAAGVVTLDQPVADALGVDDPGLARVSLEDLATHRSGLPRLPADRLVSAGRMPVFGGDPYRGQRPADVIAAASGRDLPADDRDHAYSNLGVALLGQALAEAAGQPYADLLTERIARPLGLEGLWVADAAGSLPAHAVAGRTAGGTAMAPWISEGYAPAGMVWSSAEDLARLLQAVMAGDAPGMDALRPIAPAGEDRQVGLGWMIEDDGTIWHNGRPGGFSAWAGLRPDEQRAVVVLARTDASIDAVGPALLDADRAADVGEVDPVPPRPGLVDLGLFVIAIPLWLVVSTSAIAWRGRRDDRPIDRIDLASLLVTAVGGSALSRTMGAWQVAPLGWLVAVGITSAAIGSLLARMGTLPTASGPRPGRRWAALAGNGVAAAVLLALLWWP